MLDLEACESPFQNLTKKNIVLSQGRGGEQIPMPHLPILGGGVPWFMDPRLKIPAP